MEMHFALGLFRLGFEQYLAPIATAIDIGQVQHDFPLKTWNKHDQFLLMFTTAGMKWLLGEYAAV